MKEKITSVFIKGKLWQDGYGNTYHQSVIHANGRLLAVSPVQYGYGNMFEYTALDVLVDLQLLEVHQAKTTAWFLEKFFGVHVYTDTEHVKKRDFSKPYTVPSNVEKFAPFSLGATVPDTLETTSEAFKDGARYALEAIEEIYGEGVTDTDIWADFFPSEEVN